MKKLFYVCFAAALFTACDNNDDPQPEEGYDLKVLTFEDSDYQGDASNYWTRLVDSQQYGGSKLYGDDASSYVWEDTKNTCLKFNGITGQYKYSSGGEAISNYTKEIYLNADYTTQLAVPVRGGHNGSKNFCVHFGYVSNATFETEGLQYLSFSDGVARVIDHMYVIPTSYTLSVEEYGNAYASKLTTGGWLKIVAYGVDASGKLTGTEEFYLCQSGNLVKDWTKWDLSSLGKVAKIVFNMEGSDAGEWGLNTPAYFAYDDVAVRFDR